MSFEKLDRPSVPAVDEILGVPHQVLDHGFIRVIDYMGDDAAIVQAARVSYGKGTKKISEDKGLINYLMRRAHTTPFEMCEIKLHVKLPIFVARQWIRHRTANVNEYSARYSVLDKEFYIPEPAHLSPQSMTNKQGRNDQVLSHEECQMVLNILKEDSSRCYDHYLQLMNVKEDSEEGDNKVLDDNNLGISREIARINLPLNCYTQWYWKIDLHNLLHFIRLRADPHAQYEIRAYAQIMMDIVAKWVPYAYEAFRKYGIGSINLSSPAVKLIQNLVSGCQVKSKDYDMSKRELIELAEVFGLQIIDDNGSK